MKLKLIERRKLFDDVESFFFEPEQPLQWQPGQYMHYFFEHPGADSRGTERWFTISAPPFEKNISITTRFSQEKSSSFKRALQALKIGDTINAEGPGGKFVITDSSKKPVLVAGGIGVTPYHSMLLQMDHDAKPINLDLLYANRDQNFVFGDEFAALQKKHPNFRIHKFVGERHIKAADLKPYADDDSTIIYLSGPEPMVEAYEDILKEELNVPAERLKTDFFPGYDPF